LVGACRGESKLALARVLVPRDERNSSSQSIGLDLLAKHAFAPWALELDAHFLRAEESGVLKAKKLFVGVRGAYSVSADFDAFVATSYLQDQFAGLDPRLLAAAGMSYKLLKGPVHELAFDGGVTSTKDTRVGDGAKAYAGATAAARYLWNITKTSKLTENFALFPNFDHRDDWRIESTTGLEAAISTSLAVKLSYAARYANRPVAGFGKTDTQTAASLVITLK
jgi:putative salt-induced outer membrane protein YdiY